MTSQQISAWLAGVGLKIRQLRQEHAFSREQLAEYANINPVHLWRIEKGSTSMKITTLKRIAKALKVEVQCLLADNQ